MQHAGVLVACAASVLLLCPAAGAGASGTGQITILFTTDLYGRFAEVSCGRESSGGDFANLVTAVDGVREELRAAGRAAPLVLNGGDNIGPHAFTRFLLSRGRAGGERLAAWLKRAGYDLIGLGNHDFYAVPARLRNYLEAGRDQGLVFSAANLDCVSKEGGLCSLVLSDPRRYRTFNRLGLTIAVFSVIHGDLAEDAVPDNLQGLTVVDPFARARELVAAARAGGADLVVILSHLDHSETSPRQALQLAREVPDADLIVANAFTSEGSERGIGIIRFADGATPIVGSDLFGQHLGRAELTVKQDKGRWRIDALDVAELDPAGQPPDPELRAELDRVGQSYCDAWDRPVGDGKLTAPMDPATFENYLMEIMRHTTRSELAFLNRGMVNPRSVFPIEGGITRHDFFSALPHRNPLYTFNLNVEELNLLCQRMARDKLLGQEQLLVRGLSCPAAEGEVVLVNGRALESGETYTAVTIAYLARGMLGYFELQKDRMVPYRPDPDQPAPILGQLARAFLSSARFTGPDAEPVSLEGNFCDLADRLRWSFQGGVNLNIADTSISNGPGYEESQLTRDEFIALKSELRGKIGAQSSFHGFSLEGLMKYARSATNDQPFVESEDLTTINAIYRLNALRTIRSGWYVPSLYLEAKAETEITKPDEERDYHHLELTGTVGTRFTLLPTLEAKAGIGVRREMFEPGSKPVYGFDLGYELVRTDLFTLLGSPFQAESLLSVFFGDVGRSNTLKGRWTNRLYFALMGPVFFNITHELFVYRYSTRDYGVASDLTFGLSYNARTAVQTF